MSRITVLGITGIVALAAVGGTAAAASSPSVQVKDNKFSSRSITVRKGTTVTWVWKGSAPHNVTATGPGRFNSKTQTSGRFSKKLTKSGTYSIVCTIHAPSMKMTVKVK